MSRRIRLEESWLEHLTPILTSEGMSRLRQFLIDEQKNEITYPPNREIFSAFNLTPFHDVRVVILGQDPYHGLGQAHGLSFSVRPEVRPPPSLQNIFQELQTDLNVPLPPNGDLTRWATQGVLLLNTVLTVRARKAGSHRGRGWEAFTDEVIRALSTHRTGLVFILWGRQAREKRSLIDLTKHITIESAHPSPYSAHYGFFGSRPFSRTNEYLRSRGSEVIRW